MEYLNLFGEMWSSLNFSKGWTVCVNDWQQGSDVVVRELIVFKKGMPLIVYVDPVDQVDWYKLYYLSYPHVLGANIEVAGDDRTRNLRLSADNGDKMHLELGLGDFGAYNIAFGAKTGTAKEFVIYPEKIAIVSKAAGAYLCEDMGYLVPLEYSIRPGEYELPRVPMINVCRMELETVPL